MADLVHNRERLREICLSPTALLQDAVDTIDRHPLRITLVVDEAGRLAGTVTDADLRRAMLGNLPTSAGIDNVMNRAPTVATTQMTRAEQAALLRRSRHRHLPLTDQTGVLLDLLTLPTKRQGETRDNWVVLMAGGAGTRLRPLTEHTPKPLLQVGRKPILEQILERFVDQGFHLFFLAVHYKEAMVRAHFGCGRRWGVEIRYLREDRARGTAGALSLLPAGNSCPVVVMNGDLLTNLDFRELLAFHEDGAAPATMCVREYGHSIPYGVVRAEGMRLKSIDEKPVQTFFVNAGIYVLAPALISRIPSHRPYDMPELFTDLAARSPAPSLFPIREYWLDIGQLDDYKRANAEFAATFSPPDLTL